MITTVKIVRAHAKALYWKRRVEKAQAHMKVWTTILANAGKGKHETEYGFFTVSENNVYDQSVMLEHLTEAEAKMLSTLSLDNKKVKVMRPEVYEEAKERRGWKVAI